MKPAWLELPQLPDRPLACALGNFDGVHLGHQAVLTAACQADPDLLPSALVLDPHPRQVLRPSEPLDLLTTMAERAALLQAHGVRACYRLDFDDQVRQMSPEAFVQGVLHERLGVRLVVVGRNYRFGHRAAGDVAALQRLGKAFGIRVRLAPQVRINGTIVSASLIRQQISDGRLAEARRRLGRPYQIGGTVVHGDSRGRLLGYPTANLTVPAGKLWPAAGIYAAWAGSSGGSWRPAAVHVGPRPMFGPEPVVEVHFLAAAEDLYGRQVQVALIRRLRDAAVFPSLGALVRQMGKDVAATRRSLAKESQPPPVVEPGTWL